jgi:excisionase family DNA binding protein
VSSRKIEALARGLDGRAAYSVNETAELPGKNRTTAMTELLSPREAAKALNISVDTLRDHVAQGSIRYVQIGASKRRPRKAFTPGDLEEFITNQTRRSAALCPSTKIRARHSGSMTSSAEVVAFAAQLRQETEGKRKR